MAWVLWTGKLGKTCRGGGVQAERSVFYLERRANAMLGSKLQSILISVNGSVEGRVFIWFEGRGGSM